MPIDFSEMSWLNPPPENREENGRLIARSGLETDFWQGTYYGFHRDSGHFLHQRRRGDFVMETCRRPTSWSAPTYRRTSP